MEELLKEIRDELRQLRKLHENAFGIQTNSIQELGVVDKPVAIKRLSISKNDDVMFEEEVSEGRWANSQIRNICGRLAGLTTRLTEEGSRYGQVLYGYLEINADVVYSIRFNTEKNFPRLLVSAILAASYEQLAGVMTLSVEPGTEWKSTRFPNLTDSFGFQVKADPISKADWTQNRESYLEQAALKIKAARSNAPMLGKGNNIQAIAPAQIFDTPPSEQSDLVQKVIAEARAFWGEDFKDRIRAHSATHFGGLFLKDMTIAQLQQYLKDLKVMQQEVS